MSKRQQTEDETQKQNDSRTGLKHHGRFDYTPINKRLPNYDWPNEGRLAVYIAVNLEHFDFGKGLGAKLAPSSEPDVLNYSWREYGNRLSASSVSFGKTRLDVHLQLQGFPRSLQNLTAEALVELELGECLTF